MRRILLRVWILACAIWIVAWSWYYHIPSCASHHEGEAANLGWHCDSPSAPAENFFTLPEMLAIILGIPLAVLAAGAALHWLAAAFCDGDK